MKLAKYGMREWLGAAVVAVLLAGCGFGLRMAGWPVAGSVVVGTAALGWLAIAAFFRVPNRRIHSDPDCLLAPADGVVKDVEVLEDHGIEPFEGQPLVRVGIFLSVLDVHVNRAPCPMEVVWRKYKEGMFLDARDTRCIKENESLVIAGRGEVAGKTVPVAVRQISGAIARRIVCEAEPGTRWERGEIYGMIKFGSRTELFFPADGGFSVCVEIGDKVRSGLTPLACKKEDSVR